MKRYNYYTDSKTDWLMQIPSEWKEQRIKTLFKLYDERNYRPLSEVNLISLYAKVGVVQHSDLKHTTGNRAVTADGYKIVKRGDIIVNILLCWMGAIGCSEYDGVTSPAYDVYSPVDGVNSKYYHYLFRLPQFSQQCYRAGKGIMSMRWRTYSPQFLNIVVPVPAPYEQAQIVRYLDWKTSEVNKLVDIARVENKLLKEIIDVQFQKAKSSTVTKLKRIVSLEYDPINIEKDIYYQKTGMYNRGRGIFRRDPVPGSEMGDSKFQKIHSGRIMISGQFAWEAAAYITTPEDEMGVASHRYYLLNPVDGFCAEYIWAFLMSDVGQMEMNYCSHGAAGRNRPLNIKELLNAEIPLPESGKELDKLVKAVRTYMAYQSILKNEESVLQEFKNRLIFDVITGQIDVRDIEIPEYEYVEETADIDPEEMTEFDESEDVEV